MNRREKDAPRALTGKKILLTVSGSIAAYKAVDLLRGLRDRGADVRVVLTDAATRFVQPLTFEALSQNPVHTHLFPDSGDSEIAHVWLANWPDLILVAPATANLIGRCALGLADDLASSILLASSAPVLWAPAMESQMYRNIAVQRNLDSLKAPNHTFVGPDMGPLASGASGEGRLACTETILHEVEERLRNEGPISGRHITVTAGRTEEDIDPVRFITNRSTGRMGYAVAERAVHRGARVTLISGPTNLEPPAGVEVIRVRTAAEMKFETEKSFAGSDALIMAAAVLDFRPERVASSKIKKDGKAINLKMEPTEDVLLKLGAEKGNRTVIGFAMETENGEANARKKLEVKDLDLIALNDLTVEGAGVGVDSNVVTLIDRKGLEQKLPKMSKQNVADRILDWLMDRWVEQPCNV